MANKNTAPTFTKVGDGIVTTKIGAFSVGQSVKVQTDGKILVAGYNRNSASSADDYSFALTRYNSDGNLDRTFDTNGIVTTQIGSSSKGNSVTVQTDGKILVAGYKRNAADDYSFALTRYNSDGSLDSTFDTDGIVTTQVNLPWYGNNSVTVQTDGKILVAGSGYYPFNNSSAFALTRFALTRYNSDGSLDSTFGIVTNQVGSSWSEGNSVTVQTDGEILVAGSADGSFALTRYHRDGSFARDDIVTTKIGLSSTGYSVTVQTDGKILVAGESESYDSVSGHSTALALTRYNTDGSLDSTFDTDGIVTTQIGSSSKGYSVTVQTDGKILVAGESYDSAGKILVAGGGYNFTAVTSFALTRYNTDGSLDSTFDTDGIVTTQMGSYSKGNSVTVQTDGKILVAGEGYGSFALTRYNTDGSLDGTFDTDGIKVGSPKNTAPSDGMVTTKVGGSSIGHSVTVQTDGKILVAGEGYDSAISQSFALTRYNSDGSLDDTFDTDGIVTTKIGLYSKGNSVTVQTDGKILVAGESYDSVSGTSFALTRYNRDGSLDSTFDKDGIVTTKGGSLIGSVTVQTDGKILVAGESYVDSFALIRYNTDGSLDNTFHYETTKVGRRSTGYSVTVQTDGKILVAGESESYDSVSSTSFALTRYNRDGSLDRTFDKDGIVTTQVGDNSFGNSVTVQTDGKILVAGYSYDSVSNSSSTLIRYNTDGSLDSTFDTDGIVTTKIGSYSKGYSVTVQTDGKILVAGSFALIRYNTDGSLDSTFGTDGVVTTKIGSSSWDGNSVTVQADGKILVTGESYDSTDKSSSFALIRYNTDGSLDLSFDSIATADNDLLFGTDNANKLSGLAGDDTLVGGLGADTLTGGKDADTFKYTNVKDSGIAAKNRDTIIDFKHSEKDKIDLSGIDANANIAGDQAFKFITGNAFNKTDATGQLRFDATSHTLYGSTNADTTPEFSIQLSGVKSLVNSDFVL